MRVGMYVPRFPAKADYNRDYTEVAAALVSAGHDVTALLFEPPEEAEAERRGDYRGVVLKRVCASGSPRRPMSAWAFARRNARELFDVFFGVEWWNPVTHALAHGCVTAGVPAVISPWASLNPFALDRSRNANAKRLLCRLVARLYGRRPPALQLYSETDAAFAAGAGLGAWPWFEAPLGTYDDYDPSEEGFDIATVIGARAAGRRVLFFNARLDLYQKGYDCLVEGFRQAAESRGSDFRTFLVLSGKEPVRSDGKRSQVAASLASPLVRAGYAAFLGELPLVTRTNMLARCDAFVYPSRVDGPPRPLREALRRGTPIVVTPHTGLGEWVSRFGAGITIAEPTATAVRNAVIRFDLMPAEELESMRGGARSLGARLSWSNCGRDYERGLATTIENWSEAQSAGAPQ